MTYEYRCIKCNKVIELETERIQPFLQNTDQFVPEIHVYTIGCDCIRIHVNKIKGEIK